MGERARTAFEVRPPNAKCAQNRFERLQEIMIGEISMGALQTLPFLGRPAKLTRLSAKLLLRKARHDQAYIALVVLTKSIVGSTIIPQYLSLLIVSPGQL
jgi:hypothetical protein